MVKWLAFIIALVALGSSADKTKVQESFERVQARLDSIEGRKCLLMAVMTPTGTASICANQ